jgi:hypothetical protein
LATQKPIELVDVPHPRAAPAALAGGCESTFNLCFADRTGRAETAELRGFRRRQKTTRWNDIGACLREVRIVRHRFPFLFA